MMRPAILRAAFLQMCIYPNAIIDLPPLRLAYVDLVAIRVFDARVFVGPIFRPRRRAILPANVVGDLLPIANHETDTIDASRRGDRREAHLSQQRPRLMGSVIHVWFDKVLDQGRRDASGRIHERIQVLRPHAVTTGQSVSLPCRRRASIKPPTICELDVVAL
jgi:hypothetical protein